MSQGWSLPQVAAPTTPHGFRCITPYVGTGSTGERIPSSFSLPNPCLLRLSASPAFGDRFGRAGGGLWATCHGASSHLGPSQAPPALNNHFAVRCGNALPQSNANGKPYFRRTLAPNWELVLDFQCFSQILAQRLQACM